MIACVSIRDWTTEDTEDCDTATSLADEMFGTAELSFARQLRVG